MLRLVSGAVLGVLLCSTVCAARLPTVLCPTLAQDITVTHQAEFATAVAIGDDLSIAQAYNERFSPDYWVWRTGVSTKEIYELTTPAPDTTTWNWTTYIQATAREADAWTQLFASGSANFALFQVRDGITKIFGGAGANALQRTHILTVARRRALRGEQLFHLTGTGFGAGTTTDPATMGFEGKLTIDDIACALRPTP